MTSCPECGTKVSSRQDFCTECGTELEESLFSEQGSASDHIPEYNGQYVSEETVAKIEDILDPSEKVHHLTRGSTVDVEGSSAGSSLFGDDRSRKMSLIGHVRAAFTNKRVVVKIPQVLGTDERSIPYDSITSVDLDTGLVNKRITLQTPGQTYHIEAHKPDKEACREISKYVREKITGVEDKSTASMKNKEDSLDKIEKLKELNDQGIISNQEFEKKKQELLDDV